MYNRYIQQPDGSYQRNRMPDNTHTPPQASTPEKPIENPSPSLPRQHNAPQEGVLGLLKNLLPKSIDMGDLIIILLVLLMATDCEENRNHALLTLALYFFL